MEDQTYEQANQDMTPEAKTLRRKMITKAVIKQIVVPVALTTVVILGARALANHLDKDNQTDPE
jgi:hypothetical protein